MRVSARDTSSISPLPATSGSYVQIWSRIVSSFGNSPSWISSNLFALKVFFNNARHSIMGGVSKLRSERALSPASGRKSVSLLLLVYVTRATGFCRQSFALFISWFWEPLHSMITWRACLDLLIRPLRERSSRARETLDDGMPVISLSFSDVRRSGFAIKATRAAWVLGAITLERGDKSRLAFAIKPSMGRNACLPGTTNGIPCDTRALRCLESICATSTTGRLVLSEIWTEILLSSGREDPRSISAAIKSTPLQMHR